MPYYPPAGTGSVTGPGSSTDTAVARFNGTTGLVIQNSGVLIDSSNNITSPGSIGVSGAFNESTTTPGFYAGGPTTLGTPRFMLADGTATRNWEFDNNGGQFRVFTPGKVQLFFDLASGGGASFEDHYLGFNGITAPAASAAGKARMYLDSTSNRVTLSVNALTAREIQIGDIKSQTASGAYTVLSTDSTVLMDATLGAQTANLPAVAGCTGRIYTFKKVDGGVNSVTIDANSSETIDGALTVVLSLQYKYTRIQSNGTAWFIIGNN